jgi:hypothetical protein
MDNTPQYLIIFSTIFLGGNTSFKADFSEFVLLEKIYDFSEFVLLEKIYGGYF